MVAAVAVSGRDLRTLAGIVGDDRGEPPPDGVAPSLLDDLSGLIGCDLLLFEGLDSRSQVAWFGQCHPADPGDGAGEADGDSMFWEHYWGSLPCSYPERTGDLRGVTKISDFYSARQWHGTGMYQDCFRSAGIEHEIMVCLSADPARTTGPRRTLRLLFFRGRGRDFSERDRALLILLRPHLHQAYVDAERRRHPVPDLTPRQSELMGLVAAGCSNDQIGRKLAISVATVRTHLENIYDRLGVSSRTAAVACAFPDRAIL
jgi:DNA-binding CsgD family transcriptional regulator